MVQLTSDLVSVNWLNEHLGKANLVVLDATIPKVSGSKEKENYAVIPNSVFFDIKKKFSDTNAEFPNTVPSSEKFQTEARQLGINKDSVIVVYDQHGNYSSARAWWLFKYFGHKAVAVLDGGLPEWQKIELATANSYKTEHKIGNFVAELQTDLMTNFEGITKLSGDVSVLIIDARSKQRFLCEVPEPRKGLRSGVIPNSVNLPYTELLGGNTLKPKAELKYIFHNLVKTQNRLIFSCGSGITACNLALAATVADYQNLTVYDGSWTEYGTLTT